MDMTIGPIPRLTALADEAGIRPTLNLLLIATSAPTNEEVVGKVVSFLASPWRVNVLGVWASDCPLAAGLHRLGLRLGTESALLRKLRPRRTHERAVVQMRGSVDAYYLAAMAASEQALHSTYPQDALFLEHLRLFLLIRALEATKADVPREVHIREVCAGVRKAADDQRHDVWTWIHPLSHQENFTYGEFVFTTKERLATCDLESSDRPAARAQREFLRNLSHVLNCQRRAIVEKNESAPDAPADFPTTDIEPDAAAETPSALHAAQSGAIVRLAADAGDDQIVLVADMDPGRPAPAQHVASRGLVYQSTEDVQFLRHSWHRLSAREEDAVLARIQELQLSGDESDRLGAALVCLAILGSVPLSSMSRVMIQEQRADDWTVDLAKGQMRCPSLRASRGWRAQAEAKHWIKPLAGGDWVIELPPATSMILRSLRKRGGLSAVKLWQTRVPDASLEHWFGARFAQGPGLSRLTSPVVPNVLAQRIFETHRDQAEARLLTSSHRSALPSACMYGSFSLAEVRGTMGQAISPGLGAQPCASGQGHENAAGSEMDVDVERLRNAIQRLTARVNEAAKDGQTCIDHHNLLTALCVVALFASTGARPVTSPFESLQWFNFADGLVYVEDKQSGPTQGARLCILSDASKRLLTERYLPHLRTLAQALAPRKPAFCAQVNLLHQAAQDDCKLPLFFFLRTEPDFGWIDVSPASLTEICGKVWELPWNLFRHLHSTYLRRAGLAAEIRDALLSHGDRDAESHGQFSWRVPADDLRRAAPIVNALTEELEISLPIEAAKPKPTDLGRSDYDEWQHRAYGREARALRRTKVLDAAKRQALGAIELLRAGRPPQSLSADDWEKIGSSGFRVGGCYALVS